ncbi:MAG: phenylalanine--tRNA ligase subunit beta [Thermoleophilia bacterium]|nr:phenylalanine--tRNA ligase subunit beta [Thermoleophilia bacterium]
MKAPLSWLRDFVDIAEGPERIASLLALSGTEVERVAQVGVPDEPDNLRRFVVGKVIECFRHPNADKLSVCRVDTGESSPRTIVCGAPNVAAGQTVAVVLPGGVLPNGVRIGEAKLRGVASSGMILSEAELGLTAKSEGIMVLPDEWQPGDLLQHHFAISDWVLEVEVTPNRPDCLSIRGLAREIAAVTGVPFVEDVSYPHPWGERDIHEEIAIEVWDPDLCPRYAARVIKDVVIAESPLWLKARLVHAGLRPINNVVDVTNYVLWTLGQPLHAFDLDTIGGRKIIVRRAYPGEQITTLDGVLRTLNPDVLVIADAERASGIAGVMGGADTEITERTRAVLLEGANFAGPSIMRTEAALGLRTEASTRYEKGLDPEMIPLALDLACKLFVELCGGTVLKGTIDIRSAAREPESITLRASRVKHVLGKEIATDEIATTLTRLGCKVQSAGDGANFIVTPPTFRADLEREIDLIEEIARIHGLDNIPATVPGRREGRGGLTSRQKALRLIDDTLAGAGLYQVITYSFIDESWPERLRMAPDDERLAVVRLANPLSADQVVLRTMLLPGLLATAARNVAVDEERVHIFERGRVFYPRSEGLPVEENHVGILVLGEWEGPSWLRSGMSTDYYLAKGLVERLADALHVSLRFTRASEPFLHPGRSAEITDEHGRRIGWLGELHPLVLQSYELKGPAVAAELDVDAFIDAACLVPRFRDLMAYPVVIQDVSLVVDASVPAEALLAVLRRAGGELLENAVVFDVYAGSQVPVGKKSLAVRLSFRAPDRTLSEVEVNAMRDQMVETARRELGAELRGAMS